MATLAKSVAVEKIPVAGDCPECGAHALKRYEVLSAGGWYVATKCQECLASVDRQPWNRLGYVKRDHVDAILASRKAARK